MCRVHITSQLAALFVCGYPGSKHLLHCIFWPTHIPEAYYCGYTSFYTGKVDFDKICRLLLFPLLCTPCPFPFFISRFSFLSLLSISPSPPPSFHLSPYFCQYADGVWGLGKEGDIKSELRLCMRLQAGL